MVNMFAAWFVHFHQILLRRQPNHHRRDPHLADMPWLTPKPIHPHISRNPAPSQRQPLSPPCLPLGLLLRHRRHPQVMQGHHRRWHRPPCWRRATALHNVGQCLHTLSTPALPHPGVPPHPHCIGRRTSTRIFRRRSSVLRHCQHHIVPRGGEYSPSIFTSWVSTAPVKSWILNFQKLGPGKSWSCTSSSSSSSTTVGSMPVGVWCHCYYRCPPLPI